MKIKVNYELFEKMEEAKKGFSLTKLTKRVCMYSTFSMLIGMPLNMALSLPFEQNFKDLLTYVPIHILFRIPDALVGKMLQRLSIYQLTNLVGALRKINVNTDYELLLKSYNYETTYKIELNESFIPRLKQEKFIMVPVYELGEEKEVSLVQEHIVGSMSYSLSYGSPQKALRYVLRHA